MTEPPRTHAWRHRWSTLLFVFAIVAAVLLIDSCWHISAIRRSAPTGTDFVAGFTAGSVYVMVYVESSLFPDGVQWTLWRDKQSDPLFEVLPTFHAPDRIPMYSASIPLWVVAMLLTVAAWRRRRRELRPSADLCHSCGYDLRGDQAAICPECGQSSGARI